MEKVRELSRNPLYLGIAAGLLGLIVGWFVIGWALWPVTYYDAAPVNMRSDLRVDYLRMTIDSFAKNQDANLAKRRYAELGQEGSKALDEIRKAPGKTFPDDITKFSNALALPAGQQPVTQATTIPGTPVATKAGACYKISDTIRCRGLA
jgi:hypothetical protein